MDIVRMGRGSMAEGDGGNGMAIRFNGRHGDGDNGISEDKVVVEECCGCSRR
jgi:hypothetical protein